MIRSTPAQICLAVLAGGAAAVAFFNLVFTIRAIDPIYYQIYPVPAGPGGRLAAFAAGATLILFAARFGRHSAAGRSYGKRLRSLTRIAFPFLLILPLVLWCPHRYWTVLATLAALGFAAFRAGTTQAGMLRRLAAAVPPRTGTRLVQLLFVLGAGWGTFAQIRAHRALFLIYQDWGEYASGYLRLAFASDVGFAEYLMVGGHWNPAANLLLTPLVRLLPAPETIFAVSALAVYATTPLVYLLARKHGFNAGTALVFALLACFNPVLSNQCLSLFYGFHPIYFFAPVLLGFFLFQAGRNRAGMAAMVVLSLLIQETVAIFWAGYGLYLLLRGRWKAGLPVFFGSAGLFLLLTRLLGTTHEAEGYTQLFHYARLGSGMTEILLSPLLRPAAFWSSALTEINALFLLSLALPLAPLLIRRPLVLIAALPLLAGICLQDSPERQNVVFQYGVETTALMLAAAVIGARALSPRRRTGALVAALCVTLGAYYCFGKSVYFGKYSFAPVLAMPDYRPLVHHLTAGIEPGKTVKTTERLRGHLLFDFPTVKLYDDTACADYLALDLTNPLEGIDGRFEAFRRQVAADPGWQPVAFANYFGREAVLFRRIEPAAAVRPPFIRPAEAFASELPGFALAQNLDHFEVRVLPDDRARQVRLFIRCRRETASDFDVKLVLRSAGRESSRSIAFGHGLYPAYRMRPGEVFVPELDYPGGWDRLDGLALKLERRQYTDGATK
jgi:hypothetical protein